MPRIFSPYNTYFHLQVDSITETSALNQEAYLLFYVRQGMFPWFSSFLQEANSSAHSATKRMYPVNNDHNVFAFDSLGKVYLHI
jgi:ubiquitin carboxyl-terminal hydrolase 36/42